MKKILTLSTALGMVLLSADAMAAGFHLREQSAAAQGNAYAGATAGAEDNSYAYYNAAGITRQKGTQFTLGGTRIAPRAEAKNVRDENGKRDHDVQNIVHAAFSPNFAITHQVNDKLFLGIIGNSAFGMITKYDPDWVGADHGATSDVKTAAITPLIAYKLNDKLSFGAGMQFQYIWAHLTSSSSETYTKKVTVEGNTLDIGYQLGLLYELNDNTRFGVGYRSEVKHKIKGKMKSSGSMAPAPVGPMIDALLNQKISAKLDTPAMLSFGAYHDINDRWSVMAEYQRVFWSSFQNLTFVSREHLNKPGKPYITNVKEHWRDTNFYSIGTSFKIDDQWKLRLGFAYDESAVKYNHRTPRIPDSDRIWYSVGLSYQYTENLSFNFGYTYIYAHKASLNTKVTGNDGKHVTAEFNNSVRALAFGVSYKF
ncbi:MAG: transporter [Alphaproteobacteria bacterium]|nr:transporter [Alphaproteobacteria bacterium]